MKNIASLLVLVAATATASIASADPVATKLWNTGFEWDGVTPPGEFDYMDSAYAPPSQMAPDPGSLDAWTYVNAAQAPGIVTTGHAYKGWITGAQDKSHRPYPSLDRQAATAKKLTGPVIVSQWKVYLDASNKGFAPGTEHWIHFATFSNISWYTNLIRLNVDNGKLVVAGGNFTYVGPTPQPIFPSKKWITFTVYMDFEPNGGDQIWNVWQDDTHVFKFKAANPGGTNLKVAHWGMYAGKNVDNGAQYNDDIALWSLSAPLTDFTQPPPNPYVTQTSGSSSSSSSSSGAGGAGGDSGAGGSASTTGSGEGGALGTGGLPIEQGTGGEGSTVTASATSGEPGDGPQDTASGCALAPTPTNQGAAGLALAGALALLAVARRRR